MDSFAFIGYGSGMAYNPQDFYFKKAKKEGFLARSAYKLDVIQKKYWIIKSGDRVVDLGCAPGAWSQITLKIIGPKGTLFGVDLKSVNLKAEQATFLQKDIFQMTKEEFVGAPYNVLLSDMAPNTSGIVFRDQVLSEELCKKVLEVSDELLLPGGNLVMKLFMGGGAKEIQNEVKKRFQTLQMLKPDSTRKQSKEIFLIGIRKNKKL